MWVWLEIVWYIYFLSFQVFSWAFPSKCLGFICLCIVNHTFNSCCVIKNQTIQLDNSCFSSMHSGCGFRKWGRSASVGLRSKKNDRYTKEGVCVIRSEIDSMHTDNNGVGLMWLVWRFSLCLVARGREGKCLHVSQADVSWYTRLSLWCLNCGVSESKQFFCNPVA